MKSFFNIIIIFIFTSCQININKDYVAEGTRLMQEGDYFKADLEFDDALFGDENNLDALRGSAQCALNLGMYDKALKRANKFIELRPDSSVGYNDRGIVLLVMKKYENALHDFDKALDLGTEYPSIVYFNKGEAYRELNRDKEAISCYTYVISHEENDARAYYKMGLSYYKIGTKDSACLYFKVARNLGDKDAGKEFDKNCN